MAVIKANFEFTSCLISHINRDTVTYLKYHGQSRSTTRRSIRNYDIVLTTYETLRREMTHDSKDVTKSMSELRQMEWSRVILDEGIFSSRVKLLSDQNFSTNN